MKFRIFTWKVFIKTFFRQAVFLNKNKLIIFVVSIKSSVWFQNKISVKYRRTLSVVFLSANLVIRIGNIGLKCKMSSQNVSFYLLIQYSRPTCNTKWRKNYFLVCLLNSKRSKKWELKLFLPTKSLTLSGKEKTLKSRNNLRRKKKFERKVWKSFWQICFGMTSMRRCARGTMNVETRKTI